jgi:hypothetical protein
MEQQGGYNYGQTRNIPPQLQERWNGILANAAQLPNVEGFIADFEKAFRVLLGGKQEVCLIPGESGTVSVHTHPVSTTTGATARSGTST